MGSGTEGGAWARARGPGGGSEGLTVVGHHGVPLVVLLRRSQVMLYALKLRGQRRQRGQRGHLPSRKHHHFLLAGHKHASASASERGHARPRFRCSAAWSAWRRRRMPGGVRLSCLGPGGGERRSREGSPRRTRHQRSLLVRKGEASLFNFLLFFYFFFFGMKQKEGEERGKIRKK